MKKAIILIVVLTLNFGFSAQGQISNIEGFYEIDDIDISLNGWELYRNYDRNHFINTIQTSYTSNEEGGRQSRDEYDGIESHTFRFNNSMIFFSEDKLSVFSIVDNSFNVNGVTVGSPISLVRSNFQKLFVEPNRFIVYYGYGVLVFDYDHNVVTGIHWSSF